MSAKPLGVKQAQFVEEYLVDLNGKQAAIRAGYSPSTAAAQATRLLTKEHVTAAIAKRAGSRMAKLDLKAETILRELLRVGTSDVGDLFDSDGNIKPTKDWPEDARRAVSSIEIVKRNLTSGDGVMDQVLKVRFWDKNNALNTLAKHLGLLIEQVHVTQTERLLFVIQPAPQGAIVGNAPRNGTLPQAGNTSKRLPSPVKAKP